MGLTLIFRILPKIYQPLPEEEDYGAHHHLKKGPSHQSQTLLYEPKDEERRIKGKFAFLNVYLWILYL